MYVRWVSLFFSRSQVTDWWPTDLFWYPIIVHHPLSILNEAIKYPSQTIPKADSHSRSRIKVSNSQTSLDNLNITLICQMREDIWGGRCKWPLKAGSNDPNPRFQSNLPIYSMLRRHMFVIASSTFNMHSYWRHQHNLPVLLNVSNIWWHKLSFHRSKKNFFVYQQEGKDSILSSRSLPFAGFFKKAFGENIFWQEIDSQTFVWCWQSKKEKSQPFCF